MKANEEIKNHYITYFGTEQTWYDESDEEVVVWATEYFNEKTTSQQQTIERLREGIVKIKRLATLNNSYAVLKEAEQLLSTTEQPEHCEHETSKISDDGLYWICEKCGERQSD